MKLSKKTFIYSIGMSSLLVAMIVVYFVAMLPSLYVDYMGEKYLASVVEVQKGYMEKRSYKGLEVQNPTGSTTIEIPFKGDEIYLAGLAYKVTLTAEEENVKQFLTQVKECFRNPEDLDGKKIREIDWNILKDAWKRTAVLDKKAPIKVKLDLDGQKEMMEPVNNGQIHNMEQNILVFESSVKDKVNQYTAYIAMSSTEDAIIISVLTVMTPQMKELSPIILGSLPMIAAVLFLLVMIGSQYFSKTIVDPVIRLANYAEEVKYAPNMEITPLVIKEKDEIGDLGRSLNELYEELRENYRKLEKENKRQEVFLRASSHQLKTPITAALLLVDGMMQEVGKYKDTRAYLPQVKEQLQSMSEIVEDILYLNHCAENLEIEPINLSGLISEIRSSYQVQMEAKGLSFTQIGEVSILESDRELLKKILDNLISNAVAYTEAGGQIAITVLQNEVQIFNEKAHVEEELLPHIYEPFVSSEGRKKGKGLGLYVTAYYCGVLGLELEIKNECDGVRSRLKVKK